MILCGVELFFGAIRVFGFGLLIGFGINKVECKNYMSHIEMKGW